MNISLRNLLLAAACCGAAHPVVAQSARPTNAVGVTIVASEQTSKGGRTEVVRRSRMAPENIVIVDKNANADDLGAALAMIDALRAQFGDTSTVDFRARPEAVRYGKNWQFGEYRKWLHEQLVRLRKAPARQLADLGVVQSVQITLPAPRGVLKAGAGSP